MWRVTESAGLNERDGTYLRPQSSDSDEGRPGMRADERDRRPDPRGPMRPDRAAAEAGPQRMHDAGCSCDSSFHLSPSVSIESHTRSDLYQITFLL